MNERYKGKDLSEHQNDAKLHHLKKISGPALLKSCKAYAFLGKASSYIFIRKSSALTLNVSSFTYLLMVKLSANTGPVLSYYDGDSRGFSLSFFPTWSSMRMNPISAPHQNVQPNHSHKGKWYFMGFGYDNKSRKLHAWIDGEKVGQWSDIVEDFGQRAFGDIYLGQRKGGMNTWDGAVACVMVYSTSLDKSQVDSAKQQCKETFGKICFCF